MHPGVLLIRLLAIFAVCLALASCAGVPGRVSLTPASNPGLASRGWEEARSYAGYMPSGLRASRLLVCQTARCGGPGFVGSGTLSLPASNADGFRAVMANRSLTDAKLLQAMRLLSEGSPPLTAIGGHIIAVRKQANSVLLTFSFSKSVPQVGRVMGLARANFTASQMDLVAAAGPSLAVARQRLGLISN